MRGLKQFINSVIRLFYCLRYLVVIGKGTVIGLHCHFDRSTKIGRFSYIGHHSNIRGNVHIKDYFLCADNVVFAGKDHSWGEIGKPIIFTSEPQIPVTTVGKDVWIGRNSTIMRGVSIGDGSIIAAGSVLTKSVPSGEIWGGVPARKIKDRFPEPEQLEMHIKQLTDHD